MLYYEIRIETNSELVEKIIEKCSNEDVKDNKQLFLNIDDIDEAIITGRKVSFTYLVYGFDQKLHLKRKEPYTVSPCAMVAANEHYYLIEKCDSHNNAISHFRIDKISDIKIIDILSVPMANDFSVSAYKNSAVLMYGGKCGKATFRCDNIMLQNVVDKFGVDAKISKNTDETFEINVSGSYEGLLYWSLRFLDCCEILEPVELREKAKELIKQNKYGV